jgi:hypothetical protein
MISAGDNRRHPSRMLNVTPPTHCRKGFVAVERWSFAWHIMPMRQVLSDIEAGKLSDELKRRGVAPTQRVRAVVDTVEQDAIPITAINRAGGSFEWLADEPDLYSDADLVERYRA